MPNRKKGDTPFIPFLKNFDCFGWVPTIRGKLSLNFNNSDKIWGDTDKYAISVKTYDKQKKSKHYLVASSLYTFVDSKKGKHYCRTFRFIFKGSINDENKMKTFTEKIFEKIEDREKAKETITNKELLIGRLIVTAKKTNKLTEKETELLKILKDFEEEKKIYNEDFFLKAVVPEKLECKRKTLKEKWEKAEKTINSIEEYLEEETRNPEKDDRIYKFEVALSRDGILFLKDVTIEKFKNDYFNKDTINNYTENIPIPRIFKTSIHFIKFLFHKNYHHHEGDDTFLPASNLHPIKNETEEKEWAKRTERINKHQFDAFLNPIIHVKRGNQDGNLNCRPSGIILYAQSLLNVLEKNQLITEEEAKFEQRFLETQKEEVEECLKERKVRINQFIAQDNNAARITAGLAFLAAGIGIFNFLLDEAVYPKAKDLTVYFGEIENYIRITVIGVSFTFGVLLNSFVWRYNLYKEFRPKRESSNILNRCSNTKKGKFSIWYRFRLLLVELRINAGSYGYEIIKGIIYLVACGIAAYYIWEKII